MAFFDTKRILKNYRAVQADFGRINGVISCARDAFDDEVVAHLMLGHQFLNERLGQDDGCNLLSDKEMLDLNTVLHLGFDHKKRAEFNDFIVRTREKFYKYYPDLAAWYERHESKQDDPYKIAGGLYVRILAAPQLFYDGNHRTGALIANFYLMKKGKLPFVLTPDNAVAFFNLASDVKFKKMDIRSKFKRAVGWRDEMHAMRDFLRQNAQDFTISKRKALLNENAYHI